MKTRKYDGWAVVGKFGRIIAMTFDDINMPTLVQLGFTQKEAETTKERVYRVSFTLPPRRFVALT